MQREFSKELVEDRTFEIGGEVYTWRYPQWEETAALYDEDFAELQDADGNGTGEFTFREDTSKTIERIKIFLEPADRQRWDKAVKRKANPIPHHQIIDCYKWLVRVTSGRPTQQPSDSLPGAGETGASSSDASSSPEATPEP